MISLADFVSLPTKVVWPIALFSNSESIFGMTFVSASGQLTTHSVRAGAFTIYKSKAN